MTVCQACGSEKPKKAQYGDVCKACGQGTYSQHEDALVMEHRRLGEEIAKRSTHTEVSIGESVGPTEDVVAKVRRQKP